MAQRPQPAEVYSLWLRPAGTKRRRLALVIARLARRCGTQPFDPHVTLLGGIALPRGRAIEKTEELARGLRPLPVRLRGPGHEAAFFRCLYLRAAGSGLRRARARAVRTIHQAAAGQRVATVRRSARRAGRRFRPHLSLVYGRLPAADRRRLARDIGESLATTFAARDLALVRTSGEPRAWRVVAVRRLGSESPRRAAPGPRPPGTGSGLAGGPGSSRGLRRSSVRPPLTLPSRSPCRAR